MKLVDLLHQLLDKLLHHAHTTQDGNAAALLKQMKDKAANLNHLAVTAEDAYADVADQTPSNEVTNGQKEEQGSKVGTSKFD